MGRKIERVKNQVHALLEELMALVAHHRHLAKIAESDVDSLLLMSSLGMDFFTALAVKSRIGDISRSIRRISINSS